MKNLIYLITLFFVACSNSSNNSTVSLPLIQQNVSKTLRPFVSTCNGTSRVDDRKWTIQLGNGTNFYYETDVVSSSCSLLSKGTYTFDVATNTLTLVQTEAKFQPENCGGVAPNNYTRSGVVSRISVDQLKWNYVDYNSANCETVIRE